MMPLDGRLSLPLYLSLSISFTLSLSLILSHTISLLSPLSPGLPLFLGELSASVSCRRVADGVGAAVVVADALGT